MTDNELLLAMSDLMDAKLKSALESGLQPIKDDIRDLKIDVENMDTRLGEVEVRLGDMDTRLGEVEVRLGDMDTRLGEVEVRLGDMDTRLGEVEVRLGEVDTHLGELDTQVRYMALHIENVTDKNIQLLAENYVPAAKQYERASVQIDAMEADIDLLKKVVTSHSEKIQKLA